MGYIASRIRFFSFKPKSFRAAWGRGAVCFRCGGEWFVKGAGSSASLDFEDPDAVNGVEVKVWNVKRDAEGNEVSAVHDYMAINYDAQGEPCSVVAPDFMCPADIAAVVSEDRNRRYSGGEAKAS